LIANISGTDQAIDKRKTALSTTIFCTFDKDNLVNFGPLTKKTTVTFDLWLEIKQGSCGHRGTCACKISSSWVQRFMSYRASKLFACKHPEIRSGPVTLTVELWPWNYLGFLWWSRNMFTQNFIELSAAVHELSCEQKLGRKHYSLIATAPTVEMRYNISW